MVVALLTAVAVKRLTMVKFIYPWPSLAHRSLAEVAETDRLAAMPPEDRNKLGMAVRFDNLLRKAKAFSPPPEPDDEGSAA